MLVEQSRDLGIGIHFNVPMDRIETRGNAFRVLAVDGNVDMEADLVLHGPARAPLRRPPLKGPASCCSGTGNHKGREETET